MDDLTPYTPSQSLPVSLLNPNKPCSKLSPETKLSAISPRTAPFFCVNSRIMPSVTEILKTTLSNESRSRLDLWEERMVSMLGMEAFRQYRQATLLRGQTLHSLVAEYFLSERTPIGLDKESFNLWKSIHGTISKELRNVRMVEHRVEHAHLKYRGIIDCVAQYMDELVVVEFKTSERPRRTIESLFDGPIQVSAYCGALNNDPSVKEHVVDRNVYTGLIIVANTDGSPANALYMDQEQTLHYWNQWLDRLDTFLAQDIARPSTTGTDQ